MNIDDLTIKQARELSAMFCAAHPVHHPLVGKKVLVMLPGRFIYMGTLELVGGYHVFYDAQNIRYWTDRKNALGGLAKKGLLEDDKIDDCPPVWFPVASEIAMMEIKYE